MVRSPDCFEELCELNLPRALATEGRNQHTSFMSLPREVRNIIYRLALVPQVPGEAGVPNSSGIRIDNMVNVNPKTGALWAWRHSAQADWIRQPALTMVSRQIRQETIPLYYGMNKCVAYIPAYN